MSSSLHDRTGFTLLELMVSIGIIGILYSVVFGNVAGVFNKAYTTKMKADLKQLHQSFQRYAAENGGSWPDDADAGDLPTDMGDYMVTGSWPEPPFEGALYDWDNFTGVDGRQAYQVSVRFCDEVAPWNVNCNIPDVDWSENFSEHFYSSYYICIRGGCVTHRDATTQEGFCVNCN